MRACVLRSFDRPDTSVEDPRNPIGFCEDGRVADAQRQTDSDPHDRARHRRRFGQDDEGHAIARQDSNKQDVAQFPSRCHDDGRVVEAKEHCQNEHCEDYSRRGEYEGHYAPCAAPLHVFHRKLQTAQAMRQIRQVPWWTGNARVRVHVLVVSARKAVPAALFSYVVPYVANGTRTAADGLWRTRVVQLVFRRLVAVPLGPLQFSNVDSQPGKKNQNVPLRLLKHEEMPVILLLY